MAVAAPRRRADRDKDGVRAADRGVEVGGESEPPGGAVGPDQLLEAGLEDRHLAPLQPKDLRPVLVDADNRHAKLGKTRPRHQADIPGPDHRYSHHINSADVALIEDYSGIFL